MKQTWVILTGEYPPQPGGVSDYARMVAQGLCEAGDEVEAWAPPASPAGGPAADGVIVRRMPDHFGAAGMKALDRWIMSVPRVRLFLQYVPHAFGKKGMNLAFCRWLHSRARRMEIWTLFHEVAFPMAWRQPLRHNVLGAANRVMALLVARASRRLFVTIPGWADLLRPMVSGGRAIEWLPVPSTLPALPSEDKVAAARRQYVGTEADTQLVGHFGTYGGHVSRLLEQVLPALLTEASVKKRVGLLLGRGGAEFGDTLIRRHPPLAGRLFATGGMEAEDVAAHLSACDLLVQPYPDGVSCRRTSVMAGLALGVPVVTCRGQLTESIWEESGAVALAAESSAAAVVAVTNRVLANPDQLHELGKRGAALYESRFHIRRTIDVLRGVAPAEVC